MVIKSDSVEGERGESLKTDHQAAGFLPASRGRLQLKLQDCRLELRQPERAGERRDAHVGVADQRCSRLQGQEIHIGAHVDSTAAQREAGLKNSESNSQTNDPYTI